MQSKPIKSSLLFSAIILCIGMNMSPVQAEYVQSNDYRIQTQPNGLHKIQPLIVAGSPAVCKANYDQCIRGCDGFAQCNNQCMINYNGCLR